MEESKRIEKNRKRKVSHPILIFIISYIIIETANFRINQNGCKRFGKLYYFLSDLPGDFGSLRYEIKIFLLIFQVLVQLILRK